MADDLDVESWLEAPYKPEASIDPKKIAERDSHAAGERLKTVSCHFSKAKVLVLATAEAVQGKRAIAPLGIVPAPVRGKGIGEAIAVLGVRGLAPLQVATDATAAESTAAPHGSITAAKLPLNPLGTHPQRHALNLCEADRDQRTVFVIQLAARLTTGELRDFFSKVGRVRDARIVSDRNSRRSKGVGYVEFYDIKSVEPALALTGQKLLGIPVIVQNTEAEKNRIAEANAAAMRCATLPTLHPHRLYIGNLQYNLSEDDLRQLFEPFGAIDIVEIPKDLATGRGRGYAFIQNTEDSKIALTQMNGFELGGRPPKIRVGLVSDKVGTGGSLDDPDGGMVLNSQSRAELMKKLARPDELDLMAPRGETASSSRSIILENMFDPDEESEPNWERLLEDEVEMECTKYGRVNHIHLEGESKGTIYVRFDNVAAAQRAVNSLNGRWFGGRQVIAKCIPDAAYNSRFPRAS
ncbi:Phosphatidylinositol-3-phosphatase SAC1 [Massospora cicadina]|nr:Phosphatidylinositol-3-phosphatase SAC1 [Massospora cicadina]